LRDLIAQIEEDGQTIERASASAASGKKTARPRRGVQPSHNGRGAPRQRAHRLAKIPA
jgi:hypothetical protein